MATITKKRGKLLIDLYVNGIRKRRPTGLPDTPHHRRVLGRTVALINAEMAAGIFEYEKHFPEDKNPPASDNGDNPTFGDMLEQWFEENTPLWSESTLKRLRSSASSHLLPILEHMKIREITDRDLALLRNGLAQQGLSHASINMALSIAKRVIRLASHRHDFRNLCDSTESMPPEKSEINPFTLDEINRIIEAAPGSLKNYLVTRFGTGLRSAEIHGLRWQNVDLNRGTLYIEEGFSEGRWVPVKNAHSERAIRLDRRTLLALKRQKLTSGLGDIVFPNTVGNPMDANNLHSRIWYPLLDRLNIVRRNLYQCRHTYASLMLSTGESPEYIARQMGHCDTNTLFTVYSRYVKNHTQDDGTAFERAFSVKGPEKTSAPAPQSTSHQYQLL